VTWTIIAKDPATGQLGIATTTHAFGVGPIADWPKAGVGVVATQSFVEVSYGPLGLDLIEQGVPVREGLDRLLAADEHREIRQVALFDLNGDIAHFTGAKCVPFCGAVTGDRTIVIGNMLAGEEVVTATLAAYQSSTSAALADRLLDALDAGQAAGGDARGRMSAGLRIVAPDKPAQPWFGTLLDLRVDFSAEPLVQLRRDLAVSRAYDIFFGSVFGPGLVTGPEPVTGDALEEALGTLGDAQQILGPDREATVWQGVLLLRAGRADEGCELIASALGTRPEFARFLDGLHANGTIQLDSAAILRKAQQ
jgi:uncharacterized Ntn-hydrolase superfamily protein